MNNAAQFARQAAKFNGKSAFLGKLTAGISPISSSNNGHNFAQHGVQFTADRLRHNEATYNQGPFGFSAKPMFQKQFVQPSLANYGNVGGIGSNTGLIGHDIKYGDVGYDAGMATKLAKGKLMDTISEHGINISQDIPLESTIRQKVPLENASIWHPSPLDGIKEGIPEDGISNQKLFDKPVIEESHLLEDKNVVDIVQTQDMAPPTVDIAPEVPKMPEILEMQNTSHIPEVVTQSIKEEIEVGNVLSNTVEAASTVANDVSLEGITKEGDIGAMAGDNSVVQQVSQVVDGIAEVTKPLGEAVETSATAVLEGDINLEDVVPLEGTGSVVGEALQGIHEVMPIPTGDFEIKTLPDGDYSRLFDMYGLFNVSGVLDFLFKSLPMYISNAISRVLQIVGNGLSYLSGILKLIYTTMSTMWKFRHVMVIILFIVFIFAIALDKAVLNMSTKSTSESHNRRERSHKNLSEV